jgi:hypothetical protein
VAPSGWDSDDDEQASREKAEVKEQPSGAVEKVATAPSGWDSDDDGCGKADVTTHPKAAPVDACGAPPVPEETFVAAKQVEKAPSATDGKTGDGLTDLLSDVLTTGDSGFTFKGSAGHSYVPNFHCINCDFQVMRIENMVWTKQTAYMFLRNNYPNVMRLRKNLKPKEGCHAYCCQCAWKSAENGAELSDVAEGLRWKIINA